MSGALALVVLGVFIALLFDYSNGMQDAANMLATVIASRAMTPIQAIILVSSFTFLGPIIGGTAVANTIGSFVDVSDMTNIVSLTVILSGLGGAIIWNFSTWWFGLPVSSSQALVGGLVGVVTVAAGPDHVVWGFETVDGFHLTGVAKILGALLLSPVLGFFLGGLLQRLMAFILRAARPSANKYLRAFQWLTTGVLAFSHGTNDAQKGMGMIAMILVLGGVNAQFYVPLWVIMASATAITIGTLTGGWRIVRTLGFGIYKVRPIHALDSQITSAGVILAASSLGAPVSTTQVVSTAIMGVGAAERPKSVRWGTAKHILGTWLITIPGAASVSIAIYWLIQLAGNML
tara:strand:+ start:7498 stop:8538 length:1041 start_codon:yes stop_codon:yes gene_type:complete